MTRPPRGIGPAQQGKTNHTWHIPIARGDPPTYCTRCNALRGRRGRARWDATLIPKKKAS